MKKIIILLLLASCSYGRHETEELAKLSPTVKEQCGGLNKRVDYITCEAAIVLAKDYPYKAVLAENYKAVLVIAKKYDSKKISKYTYDAEKLRLDTATVNRINALIENKEQADSDRLLKASDILMRAGGTSKPSTQTESPQINCTTYTQGYYQNTSCH